MEQERASRRQPLTGQRRARIHPLAIAGGGLALGLAVPRLFAADPIQAGVLALLAMLLAGQARRAGAARLAWCAVVVAAAGVGALGSLPLSLPPGPGEIARIARDSPGPVEVSGRILRPPAAVPGRIGFDLEVTRARVRGVEVTARGRMRVSVEGLPDDGIPVSPWQAGDEIEVTGQIRPPRDFATPGAASRVALLARHGVRAVLRVKSPVLVRTVVRAEPGLLAQLRGSVVAAIDRHVAGGRRPSIDKDASAGFEVVPESRAAAVLGAMMVDERALLDDLSTRQLSDAGLIHVLSISGLHVAIVAGAAWLLSGVVLRRDGARVAMAAICLWGYTSMAGMPAPAVRSAIVATVVLLGRAIARDAPPLNSLALAFLIGGVLEPGGLFDPGFQATYAAAAGLLLLGPAIARVLGRWLPRWLALSLAASFAAELFVLPVTMAWFGRVSWAGAVLNLAAVPLAGGVLFAGFALAALAPLSATVADVLGGFTTLLVDLLFAVAEPRGVPYAVRLALAPPMHAAGAFLLLLVAAAPGVPWRRARIAVACAGVVALLWPPSSPPPLDGLRVHVLDVGQGDAIVVEFPDRRVFLMDAGGFPNSRFDVGDRIVVPFLLGRGHRRLARMVVSHAHPDHAAGLPAVLEALRVDQLWLGDDPPGDALVSRLREIARRRGVEVREVRRGMSEESEGVRLAVWGPAAGREPPGEVMNDRSVVVHLRSGGRDAVLTGDIESAAEGELQDLLPSARGGLLKLAHHGSRTSSSAPFLAGLAPRLAVASCGFENRFDHPDRGVLARLTASGIGLRRTDLDGTVTIELSAAGHTRVSTARARFH